MSFLILIGGKRNVGKTTLANIIKKKTNAFVIDLSDIIREKAKEDGWEGDIALYAMEKRKKEGTDVFARVCLKKIEKKQHCVVCGIRAKEEISLFKQHFPNALFVFVLAPTYAEWRKRAEEEKPKDVKKEHAENLETMLSTASLKDSADIVVYNNEGLSKLNREAEKILLLLKNKNGDFLQNKNAWY